jgi:alkylation response protein AidB-like acyl-CoA dehydrogenase
MDFSLSTEQSILREAARHLCENELAFSRRGDSLKSWGCDRNVWKRFSEAGWLSIMVPTRLGGGDETLVEGAILMEELGRALALEPLLPCAFLAADVIGMTAESDQGKNLLRAMNRGDAMFALAHREPGSDADLEHVSTIAQRMPTGGYLLSGRKEFILGGASADKFIVSARVEGDARVAHGIDLFLVDRRQDGVTVRNYQLLDGRGAADVSLEKVLLESSLSSKGSDKTLESLEIALANAVICLCADTVGAMEGTLWATRDYIRSRRAYGATLGSFQALQHRMADMFAEVELARSTLYAAIGGVQYGTERTRRSLISAVKVQTGRASRLVCGDGIQLHGAFGMSAESKVGQYFKRVTVSEGIFGNSEFHLQEFAAQSFGAFA